MIVFMLTSYTLGTFGINVHVVLRVGLVMFSKPPRLGSCTSLVVADLNPKFQHEPDKKEFVNPNPKIFKSESEVKEK